jgi:hypothetical protein
MVQYSPIVIACKYLPFQYGCSPLMIYSQANISNTKSLQWTLPTYLSDEVLKMPAYFCLSNGITETQTFVSEQLFIKRNQSSPVNHKDKSSLGRFTHAFETSGKTSIKEGTSLNITWDSPAEYVKLYIDVPGGDTKDPIMLFGKSKEDYTLYGKCRRANTK